MIKINLGNVWVVVPANNEEKRLASVISGLIAFDYKIVVVDDNSSDKTFEIAKSFPISVLHHKINRGQGASLQTGTEFALKNNAEVIVHFDGDGQFLSEEIHQSILPILENDIDVVLGSRFLSKKQKNKKTKKQIPLFKKNIILPISRLINNLITGIKLTDAHCGFRAMNKTSAEKIKITQDKMSHNTEILSQIKKYNLKYQEVPITVIYHEFGQGICGGIKILKDLILNKFVK